MTIFLKNYYSQLSIRIVFLMLFSTSHTFGQETTIHSQNSLVYQQPQEFAQSIKDSEKGKATFYEKIVLEREEKNNTVIVYQELGRCFSKEENYHKAHHYLDIALGLAQKNDARKSICTITILKARAYMLDGDNEKAIMFYARAIDLAKKHKYIRLEIIASSSYMSLLSQMDDQLEKALTISDELLVVLDQFPDRNTKTHVQILTTMNDVFLGDGQYDKVLVVADKGIRIADSLRYKKGLSDLYIKKGIAHYYKKNADQSYFFLNKAKHILEGNVIENDFHQKVKAQYFLAKLSFDEGLYDKSIDYLTQLLNNVRKDDLNKLPIIQTYHLLMSCHRKLGNDQEAWGFYDLYTASKEAYQKSENKTRGLVFKREFDLGLEEERERTNREKSNKKYAQIGFSIAFVVLVIVGYTFSRKQKKNKKLFNKLVNQIKQLESQSQEKELLENKTQTTLITIDDQKVQTILKGLAHLEKQEYFLRPDCSLRTIAKKTKTNPTYLSKIINTYKEKNFNEYINDLRMEYVLKRLKRDKRFRFFSIKSIALEIGYKSDKSFVKHFKSKTGINPSYYIKNLTALDKEATTTT